MKKFLLYVIAATLFAACSVDSFEDVPIQTTDTTERLFVSFDEEDARIQLGEAGQPVWTEGDKVSVFYHSNINQKWSFEGETGVTSGTLVKTNEQVAPPHNVVVPTTHIVAAYPYFTGYWYDYDTHEIWVSLPPSQKYLKDSFGVSTSVMVANNKYNNGLSFKNVCGWLKLQLTGSHTVKNILLEGNNGEQVAGQIYINTYDATCKLASHSDIIDDPTQSDNEVSANATRVDASLDATITKTIVLDCSKEANGGVALDSKTPTAFYIALPPQTFSNGISITVTCADGLIMNKSTSNKITIQRNHILPMASLEVKKETPEASKIEANFAANSNIKWNYAEDAQQDAYKYDSDDSTLAVYSRQNVALGVSEEMLSQLQALGIDQLLADATPAFYTVEGENEVQNTSIEASVTTNENGDYLLNIANFEWGKTYKVQYTFQEEGVYEVILNATVTTDAERSNDIVKLSAEDATVQYQDSLVFSPFAEGAPVIDLSTAYQTIAAAYSITEEEFLDAVLGITDGKEYSATSYTTTAYDGEGNICQTLGDESKELWQTMSGHTVSVGYSDQIITSGPYKVVYTQVITLWYGQQIELEMTINIKYPRWDFVHNTSLVSYASGVYSSRIYPRRLPSTTSSALTGLDIDFDLNAAFSVQDEDGKTLTAEELEEVGLDVVFVVEDNNTAVEIDENNILYYYSNAAQINVRGELYRINKDTGERTTRISTKFDNNGEYANYVVKANEFGPLDTPYASQDTASIKITVGSKGLFRIYLLDYIYLHDYREGNPTYSLVDSATHALLIGNGTNGYANGVSVADMYKITITTKITISNSTDGEIIKFEDLGNCPTVTLDTTNLPNGMDNDYKCDAEVKITTPWVSYKVPLKVRFYKKAL